MMAFVIARPPSSLVGRRDGLALRHVAHPFPLRDLTGTPRFELEERVHAVHDHGDEAEKLEFKKRGH